MRGSTIQKQHVNGSKTVPLSIKDIIREVPVESVSIAYWKVPK